MASDERRQGETFAFKLQYVTLSICLSIHTRSSGGEVGSNTVTTPRRADYCVSLAPSPVVRYASPPLPAAISITPAACSGTQMFL